MSPEHRHSVLVLGDGLAGLATACLFARAGWYVHLHCEETWHDSLPANVATQGGIRRLERLTGTRLAGWRIGPVLELDGHGRRLTRMGAVACSRTLRDTLADRVRQLCEAKVIHAHWGGELHCERIDLVIKLSDGCEVACWAGTGHHMPLPWAIHSRGPQSGSALLACDPGGRVSLTIAHADDPPPDPESVLDALLLEAGAEWAGRIGNLRLRPRTSRHVPSVALPAATYGPVADVPVLRIGACRPGQFMVDLITQLEALSMLLGQGTEPSRFPARIDAQAFLGKPVATSQPVVHRPKQRVAA